MSYIRIHMTPRQPMSPTPVKGPEDRTRTIKHPTKQQKLNYETASIAFFLPDKKKKP